jgi:hypothetical protein
MEMMMTKVLVSAALLAFAGLSVAPAKLTATPANASPAPAPLASIAADVVPVQGRRPDDYSDRRGGFDRDRSHYRPGHRYDRAPSHWHRYHSRPRDWRRRGCVIVGPIWFCP